MLETLTLEELHQKCIDQECVIERMTELLNLWLSYEVQTEDDDPIDAGRLWEDTIGVVTPEEFRY